MTRKAKESIELLDVRGQLVAKIYVDSIEGATARFSIKTTQGVKAFRTYMEKDDKHEQI